MTRVMAIVIVLSLGAGWAVAQRTAPADEALIEKLVKDLGSDRWRVREEATARLAAIGARALPALRRALLSDDLEVVSRARMVIQGTAGLAPGRLRELRWGVQEAFLEGQYEEMIALSKEVTATKDATLIDWLWQARACELAGRWKAAVESYRSLAVALDTELKDIGGGEGTLRHRHAVMQAVARIQQVHLNDPAAAAATLAELAAFFDANAAEASQVHMRTLRDLAAVQAEANATEAAFATWADLHRQVVKVKHGGSAGFLDIERIAAVLSALPADKLPAAPYLFVLTDKEPAATLRPDEDATRRRCYKPSSNPDEPFWRYAFVPPPGREFEAIEFALDIEQLQARSGGHLNCHVAAGGRASAKGLGSVGWQGQEPTGRATARRTFRIPPGVRAVHIETGSLKGRFTLHGIVATATLRAATKDAPPILADSWVQSEALPGGGQLTCGTQTLRAGSAYRGFAPGAYRLRYEVPGRAEVFEANFAVRPGEPWGIFVNLDSPFRWAQAGPRDLGQDPPGHPGIAPLPDGSHLAVWSSNARKIMLSRSRDLVGWSPPAPATFNSLSDEMAPAVCRTQDGTVWVAFFSKRLWVQDTSTGRATLFLTSTRDGNTWTPARPAPLGEVGGWPPNPAQILQHPNGTCWLFWQGWAASGKGFAAIREAQPVGLPLDANQGAPVDVHAAIDAQGRFHLAFGLPGRGILHSASPDGRLWSDPARLVEPDRRAGAGSPQLVAAGDGMLLLYEMNSGAYLAAVDPGGPAIRPGDGLKITNHVVPLRGSRLAVAADGQALLLAGGQTSWLLRASAKDLAAARARLAEAAATTAPAGAGTP